MDKPFSKSLGGTDNRQLLANLLYGTRELFAASDHLPEGVGYPLELLA